MVKILYCYLYAKKSYGTLSKGAIFLANPVYLQYGTVQNNYSYHFKFYLQHKKNFEEIFKKWFDYSNKFLLI